MVKAIVWIVILGSLMASLSYGMYLMNRDSGILMGYAVSPPNDSKQCELQVVVPMLMAKSDPPPFGATGKPDWNQWLADHFHLTDASGNKVTFRKGGFKTKQITELQSGSAEFIALADIDAGQSYTFAITPILHENKTYARTIDGAAKEFKRVNFDPKK